MVGHAPGQTQQRPTGGDDRALGLGDAHFGPLGGDDQIAGKGDLHAPGDGKALDGGDQRLAGGSLGDAGEATVAEPRRLALDERAEVHARAEEAAGTGEHAHGQSVVGVELVQRVGHPGREGCVDRIADLRSVEGDQQDVATPLGEDLGES